MEVLRSIHSNGAVLEGNLGRGTVLRGVEGSVVLGLGGQGHAQPDSALSFAPKGFIAPLAGSDCYYLQSMTSANRLELWAPADNTAQKVAKRRSEAQWLARKIAPAPGNSTPGLASAPPADAALLARSFTPLVATALSSGVTSVGSVGRYLVRGTGAGVLVLTPLDLALAPPPAPNAPSTSTTVNMALQLHAGAITCIGTSASGWVATGGADCAVMALPLATALALAASSSPAPHATSAGLSSAKSQIVRFQSHSLPVVEVRLASGLRLFSLAKDHSLKIFDVASRSELASVSFPSLPTAFALAPLQDRLFVGAQDGSLHSLNTWSLPSNIGTTGQGADDSTGSVKAQASPAAVTALVVNLDGSKVISGHADGSILVWDCKTPQIQKLYQLTHHKSPVSFLTTALREGEDAEAASGGLPTALPSRTNATGQCSPFLSSWPAAPEPALDLQSNLSSLPNTTVPAVRLSLAPLSVLTSAVQSSTATLPGPRTDEHKLELERLNQEIVRLREANERWKKLNNKLYSVSLQTGK